MGQGRRRRRSGAPLGRAPDVLDEQLLRRAADVNEALAWEFHHVVGRALANPAIRRMESLGVDACSLARVGLERARRIRLHAVEEASCARGNPRSEELLEVVLAVAWADGVLTVLRAQALSRQASNG